MFHEEQVGNSVNAELAKHLEPLSWRRAPCERCFAAEFLAGPGIEPCPDHTLSRERAETPREYAGDQCES